MKINIRKILMLVIVVFLFVPVFTEKVWADDDTTSGSETITETGNSETPTDKSDDKNPISDNIDLLSDETEDDDLKENGETPEKSKAVNDNEENEQDFLKSEKAPTLLQSTSSDKYCIAFSSEESFTVSLSDKNWNGTLQYSINKTDWDTYDSTDIIVTSIKDYDDIYKVYFRGIENSRFAKSQNNVSTFILAGSDISCSGNIETLLDYQTVTNRQSPVMSSYAFCKLFYNCTSLTTAPELPSMSTKIYCYSEMFRGCTSLTEAPKLPATDITIGCYQSMFYGCTSLTKAPPLSRLIMAGSCYANMFYGCTSLTEAPNLPARALAESCYANMFYGCTSLTAAPKLPAKWLAPYCYYQMFRGCTSLTTLPELPATELDVACYKHMFSDCTSLKLSESIGNGYNIPYRIPSSGTAKFVEDCTSYMFANTGGPIADIGPDKLEGTPELNTTYYLYDGDYNPDSKIQIEYHSNIPYQIVDKIEKRWTKEESITIENNLFDEVEAGSLLEWNTDRFGNGKSYKPGDIISYEGDGSRMVITLFAQWTITKASGNFSFLSEKNKKEVNKSSKYYYDDKYFSNPASSNNQHLTTMSLCLAMSAFNSATGGRSTYTSKYENAYELLTNTGFKKLYHNDFYDEKPSANSIGVVIGSKKISVNNGDCTLIAVAIRGSGYEREWIGNVTMGTQGEHEGFNIAKNEVVKEIKNYISNNQITGKVKFWVTGYSRAAATANLVGAAINYDPGLKEWFSNQGISFSYLNDNYVYCFETPKGALIEDVIKVKNSTNIHNIINPVDPVTYVAPELQNDKFARYGSTEYIPVVDTPKYHAFFKEAKNIFLKLKGEEYTINNFSDTIINPSGTLGMNTKYSAQVFLDKFINQCVGEQMIVTRDHYVSDYQKCLADIMNLKEQSSDGNKDTMVYIRSAALVCLIATLPLFLPPNKAEGIAGFTALFVTIVAPKIGMELTSEICDLFIDLVLKAGITETINFLINLTDLSESIIDEIVVSYALGIDPRTWNVITGGSTAALFQAHYPELTLAWMQSMDTNYDDLEDEKNAAKESKYGANEEIASEVSKYSNGGYCITRINCAVNVRVYEGDILVAAIVDDQVVDTGYDIACYIDQDGQKTFVLSNNIDYRIEIEAREDDTVNINLQEYDYGSQSYTRIVNYYDVDMSKGETMELSMPGFNSEEMENGTPDGSNVNYVLTHRNQTVDSDSDLSGTDAINAKYKVEIESSEGGFALTSEMYREGEFTRIITVADEGYVLDGIYDGNELISNDPEYRFRVTEDRQLTAKFIKDESGLESIKNAVVTLDTADLVYSGEEQTKSVVSVVLGEKELTADDYTVSGNTGTNAGTYTLTITGKGNYKDSVTASWSIGAIDMSVSSTGDDLYYDGYPHSISVEVYDPYDHYSIKYGETKGTYNKNNLYYTDAGTYTVYYQITADNYNSYEGQETLIINKADSYFISYPVGFHHEYSGKEQELVTAGTPYGGTVMYSLDGETYSEKIPTGIDAEAYNVDCKIFGDKNHEDSESFCVSAEICPLCLNVFADDQSSKYGEDIKELTYKLSNDVGDIDLDITISTTATKYSPVDDYPIEITVGNPSVYAGTFFGTYTITRSGADITASSYTGKYDGKAHGISVKAEKGTADLISADEVIVYYSESELNDQNYASGQTDNILYTDVCDKTVYYYVTSENYDPEPIKGSQKVIISKGTLDKSIIKDENKPVVINDLVFKDVGQVLLTNPSSLPAGFTGIEYSTDDGKTWSDSPVGKDAGTYEVRVRYTGSSNYEDLEGDSVSVTINKSTGSVTDDSQKAKAINDLVYSEQGKEIVTAPKSLPVGYSKVQYSIDDGKIWTDSIPKGKGGDYTVRVKYIGDKNHNDFIGNYVVNVTVQNRYYADNTSWVKGSSAGNLIVFKALVQDGQTFNRFIGIKVDDEQDYLDSSRYSAVKGSVRITLNPSYLETMSIGEHKLTAYFSDGASAAAAFTIKEATGPVVPDGVVPSASDKERPATPVYMIPITGD